MLLIDLQNFRKRKDQTYGNQSNSVDRILWRHGRHRSVLPQKRHQRGWVCTGRPFRRALAYGIRLRHFLFFRRDLCGLRRPIWMEIRYRFHLDRHRQRANRFFDGMGGSGPPHPHYEPAFEKRHHARIFRKAFWQQVPENLRFRNNFHFSHSLHRQLV